MGRRISDATRLKRARGTGHGADYRPWLRIDEFSNSGTSSIVIDPETGRQVYLLSRGELYWWYYCRWQDDVKEIREQFPLDLDNTTEIAARMGVFHPQENGVPKVMTTDLLLTHTDDTLEAISVKPSRKVLEHPRQVETLELERLYWELQGVPFHIAYRTDLNMTLIHNIMDVMAMYDKRDVRDLIGLIRHLIAHKEIEVDMESAPLDYRRIIRDNSLEEIWK